MAGSIIVGQGGKGTAGGVTPAVGVNGSVAPTSSIEIGFIDSFGNEQGVSATNPLPVTGTVTASNPSVGLTGATAPTSATEIGVIDISGKLQGASASNPVRTDPTGTTLQPVSGTITANQGTSPWVVSLASTTITGTVAVTQSTSPWIVAGGGTAGTAATGVVTVQGIAAMTPLLVTSTFSSPQHVIVDSGTITAVTAITNALPAGTNVIGHVITDSGSTTVVTGIVEVSPTTAANTKTNPFFTEISDGANTVTVNSTTTTAKFGLDTNILSILGTAPTTAGFLDIKGADGNVFVRQTTGTNLHVVTDSTSTTAVTQATASNLNAAVVGTKTNNNAAPGATNIGTLGAIANAAGQTWTEGDQVSLSTDLNGSVRTMGGVVPEVTAAWTSATALNTALTLNVAGYSTVLVTIQTTSTITGGSVNFELSDANSNWYFVNGTTLVSGIANDVFALAQSATLAYQINVAGAVNFRVRLNPVLTGTGTANIGIQAASNPGVNIISTNFIKVPASATAITDNNLNANRIQDNNNVSAPLQIANELYGGAFSGAASASKQGWSKQRMPTVFNTVQATASGNTAVWTPGSGNKFRILKVLVQLTDNASLASGAVLTISFQDATTAMPIAFDIFVPTTAVTTTAGAAFTQELDLGDFGILSAAANNVFNVNLSAALATGNVRVIALGTEE